MRARLMDLSFSLYESLGDFLSDLVFIDGTNEDMDGLIDLFTRMNTASMNVLGDIELLTPIFMSIRKGLNTPAH
ncbi:MAG: hypothetical protein ABW007_01305 [Chitinophagaceae bacterium]